MMTLSGSMLLDALNPDRQWYRYFNQGAHWKPDGRDAVEISTMSATWRFNCMRFLERRADRYARMYSRGCEAEAMWMEVVVNGEMARDSIGRALDDEADEARCNPTSWIVTTPLYRALARGLPVKGAALRHLQERAAHWEGCPRNLARKGVCSCEQIRQEHEERTAR